MKHRPNEMYEEHNISRLGLISIMKTVPSRYWDRWSEQTIVNGVPGEIICYTANPGAGAANGTERSLGVPHGWDNEVVSAVHTLYLARGCPADGTVTTTAPHLLSMIGASPNSDYYARLRESISRLHNSHYLLKQHWFNARQSVYTDASFTQFADVQYTTVAHPITGQDTQRIITITLNRHIRENIIDDHLIRLNPTILKPLSSPTARAFYRLLEAMRNPEGQTRTPESMHVNLNVLRSRARILNDDPKESRTRRIFDPALAQLKSLGYLDKVESTRLGRESGYAITFSNHVQVVDAVSLELLKDAGVSPERARVLARNADRDTVKGVVAHVRERSEQGSVRNAPGLIHTLLSGENATYYSAPRASALQGCAKPPTVPQPGTAATKRQETPPDAAQPRPISEEEVLANEIRITLTVMHQIMNRVPVPDDLRAQLTDAVEQNRIVLADLTAQVVAPNVTGLQRLLETRTAVS